MKKAFKIVSILLILALAAALTACQPTATVGGAQPPAASAVPASASVQAAAASQTAANGDLPTLKVAWFAATIKQALTTTAYALGYFEEEGVHVENVSLQTAGDAITALTLGKVDVVPVGITQQLQFISQGQDLVIFGGSAMEGGAIIVKPGSEEKYKNWANWKGVNWGTGRSYTGDFVVRDQLRKNGIVPGEDITVTDLENDNGIIQAVAKGSVDVGYITADGVAIARQLGLSVITKVGELSPNYTCCRQTTTSKVIADKSDQLVAYERALIRAYKVIQSDHQKAIDIMIKQTGQSQAYVESGLYGEYASKYNPDPSKKAVEQFNKFLIQEGVVTNTSVSLDDHISTDIYRQALSEILQKYPDDKEYQDLKTYSDSIDQ